MTTIDASKFSTTTSTVEVDNDGRLLLGLFLKQDIANQSYRILVNDMGQILLDPLTNIPEQERWLWKNPEALTSLERGLQQAAAGDVHDLGSFAEYADIDLDD